MLHLSEVQSRFARGGVETERVGDDHLELRCGAETMVVRIMDDPGHPERVHLRSVTDAGEVTISTQRASKLKSLIDYARVLQQAAERK